MPDAAIPLVTSLADCYASFNVAQTDRWKSLEKDFFEAYEGHYQHVARAPGRVNILGEHIDYCGFSVLPAAIERDTLIAFSTVSPKSTSLPSPSKPGRTVVHLRNTNSKYAPTSFEVDLCGNGNSVEMPADHHWSSYFIAATKGILAHIYLKPLTSASIALSDSPPSHLFVLITGSVPSGSGLSSSSAITTASVISILQVCGRRDSSVPRAEVTQVAIESERLVGVNSGGMDQAASVFSVPQHLLHIEFEPSLTARPIPLPSGMSFVIANSLVTSDKQTTAKTCYNLRVTETRLGALLLAQHLNVESPVQPATFSSVLNAYFSTSLPHVTPGAVPTATALPSSPLAPHDPKKIHELKTMLSIAAIALGGPGRENGETWEEVASRLGVDKIVLEVDVTEGMDVEPVNGRLKIWTRARHVFTEALRVYEYCQLLETSGQQDASPELFETLGGLMNDSQTSCRDDYECSCQEIDELVALARANGALGSRLTGAGWGGSTVHLLPEKDVPNFISALREGYYKKRFPKLTPEQLDDACFATKPEAGACVFSRRHH